MRLCVDDVDFDRDLARRARVFVDGKEMRKVALADEEQGIVEYFDQDKHGRVFEDPSRTGYYKRTAVRGKVEIRIDL